MTFVDRRKRNVRPANGEAPFSLEEVFFSRTNDRGIIQSGNEIFRRVSHFEWDELIGAPHKIVRHPDMPRGVFQLFWDTLQRGEFIGAYVKNRSKDNLHYWVFAVAVPCEDGYLSARIRPSSELFSQVEQLYAELREAESKEGLEPKESRDRLLSWIREQGFEDYSEFAAHALGEELLSREKGLGKTPNQGVLNLRNKLKEAEVLVEDTAALIDEFASMHTIPHNLRVIASRIEPSGGPVTVLSENYGAISRQMSEWFEKNVMSSDSNFHKIKGLVTRSLFVEGMALILRECDLQLQRERRSLGKIDMEVERKLLGKLTESQVEQARRELEDVNREAGRIMEACKIMQRHTFSLSTNRVLCKVESSRLMGTNENLPDIIDQLGAFQERIAQRLERISGHCERIHSETVR